MDRDLAWHIVLTSVRAAGLLNSLLPVLKLHATQDEYNVISKGLANTSASINFDVLNSVFDIYPDLRDKMEERLDKYEMII